MINRAYDTLAATLALPQLATEMASGKIPIPIPGATAPAALFGFPPALLPLWSDGNGPFYVGYWWHWFCPRHPTLVEMSIEAGYRVLEIARSIEQLLTVVALRRICLDDGITAVSSDFARQCELSDLQAIDDLSLKTGDELHGLIVHPLFSFDPPLAVAMHANQYRGDFPGIIDGLPVHLGGAAGLEFRDEVMATVRQYSGVPIWLGETNKPALFAELLAQRRLGDAWLCLNSPGWQFAQVRTALCQLRQESGGNIRFGQLVDAWASLPHEEHGGY